MKKNIVVVDIDGTISKIGERIKYLQKEPKDWDAFYNDCFDDEPIKEMVTLVKVLAGSNFYELVFCTGRRERVRLKTLYWMDKYLSTLVTSSHQRLLMRKDGDLRSDTVVKPELIVKAGIDFNEIAFILEDRSCMVKTWRSLGVICFQVAEGEF